MKIISTFCLIVLAAYASADPSKCYSCDDPTNCNDPLDVSKVEVMDCAFTKGALAKEITDEESVVCVTVSGTSEDDVVATYRSCSMSVLDGLPFCEYATQELIHYTDVKCSTCNEDLCNV